MDGFIKLIGNNSDASANGCWSCQTCQATDPCQSCQSCQACYAGC